MGVNLFLYYIKRLMRDCRFLILLQAIFFIISCTPRIEVATPTTPITINLNVKIDHDININVDKQVAALLESNSDLF